MKHSNLKPRKSRQPHPEAEFKCIVRVTDGNKKKYSTVITAKEHLRFQESYNTILKAHMDALKKREKIKSKPSKKAIDGQQGL
ncbi:hypothetical protein WJX72_003315 [[Myrmecia] bisecta]|uniref:Signal recognition particle 14 kDa protein n=1 Tax=[Myrmecia] bisecta TaxID=41462 RepID=A0AAW1P9C5_9CHLO